VIARFWGTRGSVPVVSPAMLRYGGNTSCVEVRAVDDAVVVLDAGTGIVPLGASLPDDLRRVDVLLGHLHMDHILGLGFFAALFRPDLEVHLWGPSSTVDQLRARLSRYLSPPLFPVRLRDLPCRLEVHDVPLGEFDLPGLRARAALVCHPGPTVGYRLDDGTSTLAYLSDHEPALGVRTFPESPRWTSGYELADGVDVVVHDAQYTDDEYASHVGWGHSSIGHAVAFATLAGAQHLVAFHHDPWHTDDLLDGLYDDIATWAAVPVTPAREGMVLRGASVDYAGAPPKR
jgi:phosphoribosyl 1,2-cyclic phosphodiesterase